MTSIELPGGSPPRIVTPLDVVAEARSWLGVRLFHRGRTRAGGVDCLGLALAVGIGSGALDDPGPAADRWMEYARLPNPRRLVEGLTAFMRPLDIDRAAPADVIALSWGAAGLPMHLAVLAGTLDQLTIIHAFPKAKKVVEMGFRGEWPARTCSAWRFPNLTVPPSWPR